MAPLFGVEDLVGRGEHLFEKEFLDDLFCELDLIEEGGVVDLSTLQVALVPADEGGQLLFLVDVWSVHRVFHEVLGHVLLPLQVLL